MPFKSYPSERPRFLRPIPIAFLFPIVTQGWTVGTLLFIYNRLVGRNSRLFWIEAEAWVEAEV